MEEALSLLSCDIEKWSEMDLLSRSFKEQNDETNLIQNIDYRVKSFNYSILRTIQNARIPIEEASKEISKWIIGEEIVRVIGAGRARLAAAIPANRLHHAGARVFVVHDTIPLPNTFFGGNIIAASASGQTQDVIDIMTKAKKKNPKIKIIGIASENAYIFKNLCDIFIPIDERYNPYPNPLRALADIPEHIISELLDAIIVSAALSAGKTDEDFRKGHEDLGPTGPYEIQKDLKDNKNIKDLIIRSLSVYSEERISNAFLLMVYKTINHSSKDEYSMIVRSLIDESIITPCDNDEYKVNKINISNNKSDSHYNNILFSAYKSMFHGDINSADKMIYHALQSGDYDSAYGILFHLGNIENWFNRGYSKDLISIINKFKNHIQYYEPRRQVRILLAKAEAFSNISDHLNALDCLNEAYSYIPSDDTSLESQEMKRNIYRLAGISSGDLGKLLDAIWYYRKAIEADPSCNDPKTTLCMGYLGYLYSNMQQMDLGLKWGELSLELCPEHRNPHVYSKNLCTSALFYTYQGNIEESLKRFNSAKEIACRPEKDGGDIREYGRVLCHMGFALFRKIRGEKKLVNFLLDAEKTCLDSGDVRRCSIALGLKGIAKYYNGDNNGIKDILKAINNHIKLKDERNAFFETLNYKFLENEKICSKNEFIKYLNNTEKGMTIKKSNLNQIIEKNQYEELTHFWWHYIRPNIFFKSEEE